MTETINETTVPTITASAQITAPEVAANQADFQAENPNLFVMTVADYNDVIATMCGKVLADRAEDESLPTDTFKATLVFSVDGISTDVKIQATTAQKGFALLEDVTALVDNAIHGLQVDPLSEHRRRHVEEILDYERTLEGGEFDEERLREVLNHAPLERLYSISAALSFVFGEQPDIDDAMFGVKVEPKGFLARIFGR